MVSIHASVKDATHIPNAIRAFLGFNPRICKRCDSFLVANLTPFK